MARVVAGDLDALGALFERHKGPLFAFLCRLLGRRDVAEDLLQDAFLRVYDRRRTFKPHLRFSAWLYAIAHHLAIDTLRRDARCDVRDDLPDLPGAPLEAEVERRWLGEAVREAIAALPAEQRTVIILREYHDFSFKEIAAIAGISEEAARVRAFRARQGLRVALADVVDEAGNVSAPSRVTASEGNCHA
jgi:RNA polymerase sigma-70 factor (ECF subfamily)